MENNLRIDIKGKEEDLSIEDKIFMFLYRERGEVGSQIFMYLKTNFRIDYNAYKEVLDKMKEKGYVTHTNLKTGNDFEDSKFYYLSASGIFEIYKRFNYAFLRELYDSLVSNDYCPFDVINFLKNRMARFYSYGEWDDIDLESQFVSWCFSNDIVLNVLTKKVNPTVIDGVMHLNK